MSLSVQSLDWETFEQYCAWQLFLAHNIPLETVIPILQHLKYKGEWNHRLWRREGEAFRLPRECIQSPPPLQDMLRSAGGPTGLL